MPDTSSSVSKILDSFTAQALHYGPSDLQITITDTALNRKMDRHTNGVFAEWLALDSENTPPEPGFARVKIG